MSSFIQNVLLASNKKSVSLHGKGMEMSLSDIEKSHAFSMAVTKQKMEEYHVPLDHVYNADQTGLFYNKLPNCMYISKDLPGLES
jgi:hypothetical protein